MNKLLIPDYIKMYLQKKIYKKEKRIKSKPTRDIEPARQKQEDKRRSRQESESKARQKKEVERKARQKKEVERKARQEVERKARQEAERKARQEVERKARQEVERKARQEAERKVIEVEQELGGLIRNEIVSVNNITNPRHKYLKGTTVRIINTVPNETGEIVVNEDITQRKEAIIHLKEENLFQYTYVRKIVSNLDTSLTYEIISEVHPNNGEFVTIPHNSELKINRDRHTINTYTKERQVIEVHPFNLVVKQEFIDPKNIIRIVGAGPVGLFAAYIFSHHYKYYVQVYESRQLEENFKRGQVFIIQNNVLIEIKKNFRPLYESLLESGCVQTQLPPRVKRVSCHNPKDFERDIPNLKISISINKLQSILYYLIKNNVNLNKKVRFYFKEKITYTEIKRWLNVDTFMILMTSGNKNLEEITGGIFETKKANFQDFLNFNNKLPKKAFIIYDKNIDNFERYKDSRLNSGEHWDIGVEQHNFRVFPTKYGQRYIGFLYNPQEEKFEDIVYRRRNEDTESKEEYNTWKKINYMPLIQEVKPAFDLYFKEYEAQHLSWDNFLQNAEFTILDLEFLYVFKPYVFINNTHMVAAGDSNFTPHFFSGRGVNDGFDSVMELGKGIPCKILDQHRNCKILRSDTFNFFGIGNFKNYNNLSHRTRISERWKHYDRFFYGSITEYQNNLSKSKYEEIKYLPSDDKYYNKSLIKKSYPTNWEYKWGESETINFKYDGLGNYIPSNDPKFEMIEEDREINRYLNRDLRLIPENKNLLMNFRTWREIYGDLYVKKTQLGDLGHYVFFTYEQLKVVPK